MEDEEALRRKKKRRTETLVCCGSCMLSEEALQSHLRDISVRSFRWKLTQIHRRLFEHRKNKGVFNVPVDPILLHLPTYFDVIKHPMDLGTIKAKLEDGLYSSPEQFASDVRLVYNNAMTFNSPKSAVYQAAKLSLKLFESDFAKFNKERMELDRQESLHSCSHCTVQTQQPNSQDTTKTCELCGRRCRRFQEPVLRCSIPCRAKIHRQSTYYRLGGDRGQHWCSKCYNALPDTFLGLLGQTVRKQDLEKRIHNQVFLEPWVECPRCKRRMHQICTLYNPSVFPSPENFVCVICCAQEKNCNVEFPHSLPSSSQVAGTSTQGPDGLEERPCTSAQAIPHTHMGRYLEQRIRIVAAKLASQQLADSLSIRVMSTRDTVTKYEPRILRWLQAQRKSCGSASVLHTAFPCRTKTILVFQKIDDVDVIIFVLYVQEYGLDCPAPNKNKVYISYLDSVAYLTPAHVRTQIYQELMVGYLTWVKCRGFERVYIWACPPQRGDAYIIYCHPKWQRNPGADRLRKWYSLIFDACRRDNVILEESNMYDEHLSHFQPLVNTRASRSSRTSQNDSPAATQVHKAPVEPSNQEQQDCQGTQKEVIHSFEEIPYFYGDYIPSEVEATLNMLLNAPKDPLLFSSCDERVAAWWREVWGTKTHASLVDADTSDKTIATVNPVWKLEPTADLSLCDFAAGQRTPQERNDWLMRRLATSVKPMADNFLVLKLNQPVSQDSSSAPEVHDVNGLRIVADTSDPDPVLPANIFDTRLEFLDVCKHNHFQFDELRRAKHSSFSLIHTHLQAYSSSSTNQHD